MISAPYVALGLVYHWTDHTLNPTGEARAVLRRVLKDLGLSGDVISDGVLAVSELVANAHEHACGPYEVHVCSAAGRYVCEIHDGDPLLPRASIGVPRRRRGPNWPRKWAGCSSSVDGACAS